MKYQQIPRKWKDFNGNTSNDVVIAQNETYIFEISDHYEIYDYGFVTNLNASSDAVLILNGSQQIPILKRDVTNLNTPFISVAVKNLGSTNIEIGELSLNYFHKSKQDNFINKGLQLLPSLSLFRK